MILFITSSVKLFLRHVDYKQNLRCNSLSSILFGFLFPKISLGDWTSISNYLNDVIYCWWREFSCWNYFNWSFKELRLTLYIVSTRAWLRMLGKFYWKESEFWWSLNWANISLFKFNNRNTRKRCGICSKVTIKTKNTSLTSFWCLCN